MYNKEEDWEEEEEEDWEEEELLKDPPDADLDGPLDSDDSSTSSLYEHLKGSFLSFCDGAGFDEGSEKFLANHPEYSENILLGIIEECTSEVERDWEEDDD